MFLSPTEIASLTGYKQPARQIRWLAACGWKFEVGADGLPKVLRAHADARMGMPAQAVEAPTVEPDPDVELLPLDQLRASRTSVHDLNPPFFEPTLRLRGIYFLFAGAELVYIGQSNCIARRLAQHWKGPKQFDGVAYHPLPHIAWLKLVEGAYIAAHKPPLNIVGV